MVFTLIAKIIGVITSIFAPKQKSKGILKTNIEEVPMLVEKEFLLEKKGLEELTAKKLAQAKYIQSKSMQLLEKISSEELQEKNNQRLNKAALTSKHQLENQLKKLLDKINPNERGKTLDDARHYSGESYTLLVNETIALRKNIAYTSFYLKDEMRELGEALQEMANLFNELNQEYAKSSDLFGFEKAKEKIGVIIQKKKEYAGLEKDKQELFDKRTSFEEKISSQKEKISGKQSGKEFLAAKELETEMNKLMNEKQDLKTEISGLLVSIDRPLQRFRQLVDSGRWKLPKEEKEMLEQFLINPIVALKKDPRADIFKKVLNEIIKAIESGDIELKDREKEKRLEALQELINFDFFGKVFWKMNEIQKKQNELNKDIQNNNAKKDITKEEGALKDLERDLFELNEKIATIEHEQSEIKKIMNKEIYQIKEFAEKVVGKTILFEEEAY